MMWHEIHVTGNIVSQHQLKNEERINKLVHS